MHQRKYIEALLKAYDEEKSEVVSSIPLSGYDRESSSILSDREPHEYLELLECYNWLAGGSRPHISFCCSRSASCLEVATEANLVNLRKALLCLEGTLGFALRIEKRNKNTAVRLYAFCDTFFANETQGKSRSRYVVYVDGVPIH